MPQYRVFKGKHHTIEGMDMNKYDSGNEYKWRDLWDCPVCKRRMHYIEYCGITDSNPNNPETDLKEGRLEAHSCPQCDAWYYIDTQSGEAEIYHFYGRDRKEYERDQRDGFRKIKLIKKVRIGGKKIKKIKKKIKEFDKSQETND